MLIILEGPDGSGKTTLANDVLDVVGGSINHFSAPKQNPWTEYAAPLEVFASELSEDPKGEPLRLYGQHISPMTHLSDSRVSPARRNMVMDRYHWGDLIYRERFLKKPSALGMDGFHGINRQLAELGALIVLVTAPVDVLLARVAARAGDKPMEIFEDPSQQSSIHADYDQLFSMARERGGMEHHLLRIDTTQMGRQEAAHTVIHHAAAAFIRQRDWPAIPTPDATDAIFDQLAPEPLNEADEGADVS